MKLLPLTLNIDRGKTVVRSYVTTTTLQHDKLIILEVSSAITLQVKIND